MMRRSRTKSRLVVLLGLVCVLLAWVIYEEIAGIPAIKATEAGGIATPGAPVPIPSEATFAMSDRQSFAVILERPLFTQTRRPSSVASEDAPAGSADFTLAGILISGNERSALIRTGSTGTLQQLKRGENIAGWTLVEIAADRAIVRRDAIETEILLDYAAPAPPGPRTETRKQGTAEKPAHAKQDEPQVNRSGDPEAQPDEAPAD
jgi:type II secretory pathway component PulC